MLFVEPESTMLAVVDVGDGSIVDLHRHPVELPARRLSRASHGAIAAQLATMVAGLDSRGSRADGVFLIGCGTDIVSIKPALEAATSLEVSAPEEPDMALARGAALASANAPLFASSTAALAYALDPGTGEMNPRRSVRPTSRCAATPAWAPVRWPTAPRDDGDDERRRRPRASLVAGSALVAISAIVAAALVVSLTSDRPTSAVRHDPRVSVAAPARQPPPLQAARSEPATARAQQRWLPRLAPPPGWSKRPPPR